MYNAASLAVLTKENKEKGLFLSVEHQHLQYYFSSKDLATRPTTLKEAQSEEEVAGVREARKRWSAASGAAEERMCGRSKAMVRSASAAGQLEGRARGFQQPTYGSGSEFRKICALAIPGSWNRPGIPRASTVARLLFTLQNRNNHPCARLPASNCHSPPPFPPPPPPPA